MNEQSHVGFKSLLFNIWTTILLHYSQFNSYRKSQSINKSLSHKNSLLPFNIKMLTVAKTPLCTQSFKKWDNLETSHATSQAANSIVREFVITRFKIRKNSLIWKIALVKIHCTTRTMFGLFLFNSVMRIATVTLHSFALRYSYYTVVSGSVNESPVAEI